MKSKAEELLAFQLKAVGIVFEREVKFHPTRKWRADFVIGRLMIEVEGAVWTNGRHTRPKGFIADLEKYNSATELGYQVYRFTTEDVKSGAALRRIEIILQSMKD